MYPSFGLYSSLQSSTSRWPSLRSGWSFLHLSANTAVASLPAQRMSIGIFIGVAELVGKAAAAQVCGPLCVVPLFLQLRRNRFR